MDKYTKVAVCSRSFSRNQFLRDELLKKFKHVKFNDDGIELEGDVLVEFLKGQDAAIIALEVINEEVLSKLSELKVIGKYGVGLDKLDFKALHKYGVRLGWTPGVNALAVAELALNLSLTILRKTYISNEIVKKKHWKQITGKQLSSLTIGILGCGHVGTEFLRLLSAFNCNLLICDIIDKSDLCKTYNATQVSFNKILEKVDLLSVHLPKKIDTLNIIDNSAISRMKKKSYLVNTARGGIVDELALLDALKTEHLAGAALDVLDKEPPNSYELINHPNCYVTSHIGGSSEEAIIKMGLSAIDGLINHQPAQFFEIYK